MKPRLIIILGPTACGKTELSLKIADAFHGEIISADSMQVYKKMDIGTAKIEAEEMRGIPHHLIDILEPDQDYSVALFQKMALEQIIMINERGCTPVIVGGTGLYINSLTSPYNFPEINPVEDQKQKERRAAFIKLDQEELYQRLRTVDPEAAGRIHPNDQKRIIRALEVFEESGRTISEMQKDNRPPLIEPYKTAMIGLTLDRPTLYRNIDQRVDRMIQSGLVDEVRTLMEDGFPPELNSMQGLGYKQIAAYLLGQISLEEAVDRLKRDTRHFAKRQLTWFKRDPRIKWFHKSEYPEAKQLADAVIKYIRQVFEEEDYD